MLAVLGGLNANIVTHRICRLTDGHGKYGAEQVRGDREALRYKDLLVGYKVLQTVHLLSATCCNHSFNCSVISYQDLARGSFSFW
jgi:hypothetical protein